MRDEDNTVGFLLLVTAIAREFLRNIHVDASANKSSGYDDEEAHSTLPVARTSIYRIRGSVTTNDETFYTA